jgi:bla regulator protein blaR1
MMQYLSRAWSAFGPAIGNHLWQSTVFLVVVGVLTLALRQNHARARHALWLAASAKFLLPFSLLAALGSYLSWSHPAPAGDSGLYLIFNQAAQPFHDSVAAQISHAARSGVGHSASLGYVVPTVLVAIWLCGFAFIIFTWCVRWRRVYQSVHQSQPLYQGREIASLRRVQRAGDVRRAIEVRLSSGFLEPGIFGIFRPRLVWPEGVSEQLSDEQLDAIVAHEVSHLRRRDNLAAAVHMLVQSIFWFHPLVWWLGGRLVEERERACDQEVLDSGAEPRVYAESILKICEFCLQSPLPCVSGVTGADLKQRIVGIMSHRSARRLNLPRKLLLVGTAFAVTAVPIGFGLAHGSPIRAQADSTHSYQFEVASIKPDKTAGQMMRLMFSPGGFNGDNIRLGDLIKIAYGVEENQVVGAPGWLNSDHYDVEAKMDTETADAVHKMSEEDARAARRQMLQALLADRMKLVIHRESRELPLYELVVAKNGSKLQEAKPGDTYPNGLKGPDGVAHGGMMRVGRGDLTAQGLAISGLARLLTMQLGRTVVDKTGLTGKYDFTLHWTPDESEGGMLRGPGGPGAGPGGAPGAAPAPGGAAVASPGASSSTDNSSPDSGPTIFTAIQEQLGLKLDSSKGPVEVIVIDHVERPSEN